MTVISLQQTVAFETPNAVMRLQQSTCHRGHPGRLADRDGARGSRATAHGEH